MLLGKIPILYPSGIFVGCNFWCLSCSFGLVVGYSGEMACSADKDCCCEQILLSLIVSADVSCQAKTSTLRGVTFASLKEVSMTGAGHRKVDIMVSQMTIHQARSSP